MALENMSERQRKNVRSFKNSTPVREVSLITRKDFLRERLIEIIENEIKSAVPNSLKDPALKKYVIPLWENLPQGKRKAFANRIIGRDAPVMSFTPIQEGKNLKGAETGDKCRDAFAKQL